MDKLINYLKYVGIFLIIELALTFITSLLNLLGLNSGITSIILFVSNIILFFILSFYNAFKKQRKGLIEGIILGGILIALMFLIKIILFTGGIGIPTLIYYLILFVTSILAGMFGVNKKADNK